MPKVKLLRLHVIQQMSIRSKISFGGRLFKHLKEYMKKCIEQEDKLTDC